ncbi:MAG: YeeE/YedE family protein [Pseudomonadota bacterium]
MSSVPQSTAGGLTTVSDKSALKVTLGSLALGFYAIWLAVDVRFATLFLIGAGLGFALYQGSFGFTGAWRRFVVHKRSRGIRAQMIMIGVAALGMMPLIQAGSIGSQAIVGAIAPLGVSLVVGAAMFGFGMQLGGGCGSGTLFTVGGGSLRMLATLAFFIVGALIGTAHLPWWQAQPSLPPVSLAEMGLPGGLVLSLSLLALVYFVSHAIERKAHGDVETEPAPKRKGWSWLLVGPWPLIGAGLALSVLSIATLLVAGHPWSVTYGFGLWGAKIALAVGIPVDEWAFWQVPFHADALRHSVLTNTVSVMNFGLILGAATAAALAGSFAPKNAIPFRSLIAAILGGLLMGYGARLSFGCNIGALFSGIASGSLHGWIWFALAFAGSCLGVAARPFFGLDGYKSQKVSQ